MDPSSRLPPNLRAPSASEDTTITWRIEVGGGARIGEVAGLLYDLDVAINVGERWGMALARMAAEYKLMLELGRGPGALAEAARSFGLNPDDVDIDVEEWYFRGPWRRGYRPGGSPFWNPDDLVRLLADSRVPALLGSAVRASRVEYQNPLEAILTGSGFLIFGVASVLTIIRDWGSTRRQGAATADTAEASARNQNTRADFLAYLVDQAKAGTWLVPPGDLLNAISPNEDESLRRLSEQDTQLQLPPGLNPPA